MNWFSARLRIVCLIEGLGAQHFLDSIVLFQGIDFDDALKTAVLLGKSNEEEYLNSSKEQVRWRFVSVLTLDQVDGASLDGCEVYSEPVDLEPGEEIAFDSTFSPESSTPIQTI